MKEVLDKGLSKLASRKLLVWLTATALTFADKIDGENWVAVSLVYIGVLGMAELAAVWKHGKN